MKSVLALGFLLLTLTAGAQPEDYVITLQGDTVPCRLIPHPRAEKIRMRRSEGPIGFLYIVAEFGGDSVRIIRPGQIRGFFKKQMHRRMGNGLYLSLPETHPGGGIFGTRHNPLQEVFLRVLVNSQPYRLLQFNEWDGDGITSFYWLENRSTGERLRIPRKRWLENWTEGCTPSRPVPPLPKGMRNEFGKMQKLVMTANACQLSWPPPPL